jgi:hypothetical protein
MTPKELGARYIVPRDIRVDGGEGKILIQCENRFFYSTGSLLFFEH